MQDFHQTKILIHVSRQMCCNHVFPFLFEQLVEKGKWETVETCGSPPSPRTCHSMVSIGSKFFVFGGGLSGPDPVLDTTVHIFNAGEIYNLHAST